MSNERFATRGNSLIGDTMVNYNLPVPMNSSTSTNPPNSGEMKNMVYRKAFPKSVEPKVYLYNEKISNWEIEKLAALESDEPLQFKNKTFIVFEYGQDKQNLTLNEFDAMTAHFIEELESMNVIVFSRSLGHKGNTIELGVIARAKITSELIRFYSKGFKNLGVNKILYLERRPPNIQYEYFYLITFNLKSSNAWKSLPKAYRVIPLLITADAIMMSVPLVFCHSHLIASCL